MPPRLTTAPITDTIVIQSISSTSFPVCERLSALDDGGKIDCEHVRDLCELSDSERIQVGVLESPHECRARNPAFLRSVRDRYVFTVELIINYPSYCLYILRYVHNCHSTARLGIVKATRRPFGQPTSKNLCL